MKAGVEAELMDCYNCMIYTYWIYCNIVKLHGERSANVQLPAMIGTLHAMNARMEIHNCRQRSRISF